MKISTKLAIWVIVVGVHCWLWSFLLEKPKEPKSPEMSLIAGGTELWRRSVDSAPTEHSVFLPISEPTEIPDVVIKVYYRDKLMLKVDTNGGVWSSDKKWFNLYEESK